MATERIEQTILRNLLFSEVYYRKVVPFIKAEYFQEYHEKIVYEEIADFASKYDKVPTQEVLAINLQNRNDLTEEAFQNSVSIVRELTDEWVDYEWLLDATEKWCKDRAIYIALMQSIKVADGGDPKISRDAIPSILQEALAVSFDEHIGHDYIDQAEDRYDFYHRKEEKVPFDLDKFNFITKGGLSNKTLNIALAGTGVGKSLFMCHMASAALTQGYNVLYITCEMAEEKIAERIDANLLNVSIKDIVDLPEVLFTSKVNEIARKTRGKLIIKEYPTASAHVGHFKALLSDLKLKKDFKPQLIFVDYLNICASARYKGAVVNSYTYVKAIAEGAFAVLLWNAMYLLLVPLRLLVVVMAIVIQILPILLSLLVYLLLLILCSPLSLLRNLNNRVASWSNNLKTDTATLLPHENSWWELTDRK